MNKLNIFKKQRSDKSDAANTESNVEEGKQSNYDEENAAPSESTVIIEDEPTKKVKKII